MASRVRERACAAVIVEAFLDVSSAVGGPVLAAPDIFIEITLVGEADVIRKVVEFLSQPVADRADVIQG